MGVRAEVVNRLLGGCHNRVNVDAEVLDNEATIRAKRQIGITPKLTSGKLRVTTIGYCQGKVQLGDKQISVRRIDQDGNGHPTDPADQIWFDLNEDGEFDLISERKKVSSFLNLNGTRYSLFSDRLGQSLKFRRPLIPFVMHHRRAAGKLAQASK